jgi:hypothetical protein
MSCVIVEVLFVTCSGAVHMNFECDFVRSGTQLFQHPRRLRHLSHNGTLPVPTRGGRLNRATHHLDYSYNSPSTTNMTPGDPYRHWFHRTISRSYYSLGEARTH